MTEQEADALARELWPDLSRDFQLYEEWEKYGEDEEAIRWLAGRILASAKVADTHGG
jgi:hypothetical protein